MKEMQIELRGIAPLLMHSCRGVNTTEPLAIEKKKLTSKRTKTEEDNLAILEIDYRLAIYHDKELGPYVPAENIEATFRESAKKNKQGKLTQIAMFVNQDRIPLIYDGPRGIEELAKDMDYRDVRVGRVPSSRASVLVCRPRFNRWSCKFSLTYDETLINTEDVREIIYRAGAQVGLCDYRPRYGRFEAFITD